MRLLHYLQKTHWYSRRKLTALIKDEKVFLNGKKIEAYQTEVQNWDKIELTDEHKHNYKVKLTKKSEPKLIAFNKPKGYVVSKSDQHNQTIYEILPTEYQNFYYLWRLDKDSHGLILLTDEPALVNKFSHPRNGLEKEYIVRTDKRFDSRQKQTCLDWVPYEDDILKCKKIYILYPHILRIVLVEGKKRHIRRMLETLGYEIIDLQRVREGKIVLGDLPMWERKDVDVKDLVNKEFNL